MISHEEAVMQDREILIRELVAFAQENTEQGYLTLNGTEFSLFDKVIMEAGYVSCKFIFKHLWGGGLIIPAGESRNLEIDIVPDDVIVFQLDNSKNGIYYDANLTLYQLFDDFCEVDGETPVGPDDLRARIIELIELCESIFNHYAVGVDNLLKGTDARYA